MDSLKSVRRSKEEKKLLRRQIKTSHTLLKHEGINTVSHPTKVPTKFLLPNCQKDIDSHSQEHSLNVLLLDFCHYVCNISEY